MKTGSDYGAQGGGAVVGGYTGFCCGRCDDGGNCEGGTCEGTNCEDANCEGGNCDPGLLTYVGAWLVVAAGILFCCLSDSGSLITPIIIMITVKAANTTIAKKEKDYKEKGKSLYHY